ncbi:Tubulin/FtsZ family [Phytophthora infestans]|uniref:Tubulin/FtsZ family n=1 Tax=Phytophthora infestans TaxID=4787 RepID=A0A833T072_PHYIN|nr:Tubulin/FtsZ family [Phytophthora infestans]
MSVHVHVGQCGNQLGAAYWRLAASSGEAQGDYRTQGDAGAHWQLRCTSRDSTAAVNGSKKVVSLSRHLFHPSTGAARCILADSEPKVVRAVCKEVSDCAVAFQPAHMHIEQAGRGNNWAMGYHGPRSKAPAPSFTSLALDDRKEMVELVMDSLQREIEGIDCYQGSVVMHSLGGGTGSGLGCRVLESMRDTYPKNYIVTASVAPSCARGDTPLQNYNTVLTLKWLQEVADAVIYKDNDELLRTASYWKAVAQEKLGSDDNQRVSLKEVNNMAAADLAGLLFPVAIGDSSAVRPFDFGKLLHDVCPMPVAKILDVRSGVYRDRVGSGSRCKRPSQPSLAKTASSATLFHAPVIAQSRLLSRRHEHVADFDMSLAMLESLVQQTVASFPRHSRATIASSTVIRGFNPGPKDAGRFTEKLGQIVHSAFPSTPWLATMPQASIVYSRRAPFPSLQAHASATICVNNGHFLTTTKRFLERAQRQFHAGAYVHWYKQHGMEDADFEAAFDATATLITEYETVLR